MGHSIRTFLIKENGQPERFSNARFERLLRRDPTESLPQRAGTHACFAVLYISTVEGEPSAIEHADYLRLKLARDGRLDEKTSKRGLSLAVGSLELSTPDGQPQNVIRAEHVFHRKQYRREFCWTPSAAQKRALMRLITEQWRRPRSS